MKNNFIPTRISVSDEVVPDYSSNRNVIPVTEAAPVVPVLRASL